MATVGLNLAQKQHLFEHGYVVIPGVVPRVMIDAALRAINASVGQGMDTDKMPIYRAQSYCPDVRNTPVITDLLMRTPAWQIAESAIGEGKLKPRSGGQIALRFPSTDDPPKDPKPHIDGTYSPTNGVGEGQIANFTALAGIYLSDVTQPLMGNFTVWPGTHWKYQAYLREHGAKRLVEGTPKIDLPPYAPVCGPAGSLVIAHYLLGHGISANTSPFVRYACFFRLTHVEHEQKKLETLTDMWMQWEGMREVVSAGGGAGQK